MSALHGRRVVFVLNWADLGGAEQNALSLAEHLRAEEGADVEVVALTTRDGLARQRFVEHGIVWRPADLQWHGGRAAKARLLVSLARQLRASRPDILMPYCTAPNVLCGLAWRLTGASLCVWNQRDVNPSRRFGAALIRRALDRTPVALANSDAAHDFLVAEWGARPERVRVVVEGLEPMVARESRAAWRARLGIGDGSIVAVMAGHLHEFKDHGTLLRAWRIVLDRSSEGGSAPVLLLAGRPAGTEDALKALAFDLRLGDRVRFLGAVDDVGGLLQASDVGVLSSRRESRPRAVLEYMACGLPVAGTDIPGIRDIVGPEGGRFLAPPLDADALAAILFELVSDASLRRSAGAVNEQLSRDEPSPTEGSAQTAALLVEALG